LLEQHPQLAAVEVPDEFQGKAHVEQWLAEQVALFGEYLTVVPMAAEDHTVIDPLVELSMMAPHVPVPVVEVPPGGGSGA
jgi:hypothetical protein